jgi:hypothetical protein
MQALSGIDDRPDGGGSALIGIKSATWLRRKHVTVTG